MKTGENLSNGEVDIEEVPGEHAGMTTRHGAGVALSRMASGAYKGQQSRDDAGAADRKEQRW
jgi:hypothetical protein